MIKRSINQKGIILENTYVPNIRASKYLKQILTNLKGEMNKNKIIIRDFNILYSIMDRSLRHKINKETWTYSVP